MPEQPGIGAYAAYLPRYELRCNSLDGPRGDGRGPVRSVAAYDEDAVTMAVEALRHIGGDTPPGRQLLLATTSAPYEVKTAAGIVHEALGADPGVMALDLRGHRSGAAALDLVVRGGAAAAMSDVRTTRPGAPDELVQGDGAVAFTGGTEAAVLLSRAGHTVELLERWRLPGEAHDRVWDERFTADVLADAATVAVRRALDDAGLDTVDHLVVSSSNARVAAAVRRTLGGGGEDATVERATGFTGAAHPGLMLAAALDIAEPGQTILLLSVTEGADAFVFRAGESVRSARSGPSVREQLRDRQALSYGRYLRWRGLLEVQGPARPAAAAPASPPMYRRTGWKYRLEGSCCDSCGKVTAPPGKACASCGRVSSSSATVSLRDKVATVVSVTQDRLTTMPESQVAIVVADVDGGGRLTGYATDVSAEEVVVGMRLTPSFRRLWSTDGIHNYFWKLRPGREGR